MKKKLSQILSLIVCLLMVAAVSLRRDGKLLGHDFRTKQKVDTSVRNDTLRMESDGTMVINTTSLGKDISGYGGTVPLEIYVNKEGVITQVKALPNGETPEFFGRASALFNAWKGKRVVLDFQGIMYVADVFVNGKQVGKTDYGYVGFEIDVTELLRKGDNELVVKASTMQEKKHPFKTKIQMLSLLISL